MWRSISLAQFGREPLEVLDNPAGTSENLGD
jgi:hypothetical protein